MFNIQDECPECELKGTFEYDHKRAETVCVNCGLVVNGPPTYVGGIVKVNYHFGDVLENELFYNNKRGIVIAWVH